MSECDTLLSALYGVMNDSHRQNRAAVARALDVYLSSLNASVSLPLAAQWFLENRTEQDHSNANDDFWASRVTPQAAIELRELVPRFIVLYGETRRCSLVGNTGASWGYSAMALLPEVPDAAMQQSVLRELFHAVVSLKVDYDARPDSICSDASHRAPPNALLRIQYDYENPDITMGHSMMRLEINNDEVVSYWPALDDPESTFVEQEALAEISDQLGLRHVRPMQLATFLAVLANAHADHTETWGGEHGVFFFDEGNIPFALKQLEGRD